METIIKDRRTEEEKQTLTHIVVGYDAGMSGWGWASAGESWAGWACKPEDVDTVTAWVKDRKDLEQIGVIDSLENLIGGSVAHFAIYAVRPGHVALKDV